MSRSTTHFEAVDREVHRVFTVIEAGAVAATIAIEPFPQDQMGTSIWAVA